MPFALFLNDAQITKAHSTVEAVAVEAFELGIVYRTHNTSPDYSALPSGYEIRRVSQ